MVDKGSLQAIDESSAVDESLISHTTTEFWAKIPQNKLANQYKLTRKCPLRGHILAPPEGLRGLRPPGVNPGGQPQESGGDSKAI